MLIGAAFGVGDLVMTAYGHHRGDEELTAATEGLKKHLADNDITITRGRCAQS